MSLIKRDLKVSAYIGFIFIRIAVKPRGLARGYKAAIR